MGAPDPSRPEGVQPSVEPSAMDMPIPSPADTGVMDNEMVPYLPHTQRPLEEIQSTQLAADAKMINEQPMGFFDQIMQAVKQPVQESFQQFDPLGRAQSLAAPIEVPGLPRMTMATMPDKKPVPPPGYIKEGGVFVPGTKPPAPATPPPPTGSSYAGTKPISGMVGKIHDMFKSAGGKITGAAIGTGAIMHGLGQLGQALTPETAGEMERQGLGYLYSAGRDPQEIEENMLRNSPLNPQAPGIQTLRQYEASQINKAFKTPEEAKQFIEQSLVDSKFQIMGRYITPKEMTLMTQDEWEYMRSGYGQTPAPREVKQFELDMAKTIETLSTTIQVMERLENMIDPQAAEAVWQLLELDSPSEMALPSQYQTKHVQMYLQHAQLLSNLLAQDILTGVLTDKDIKRMRSPTVMKAGQYPEAVRSLQQARRQGVENLYFKLPDELKAWLRVSRIQGQTESFVQSLGGNIRNGMVAIPVTKYNPAGEDKTMYMVLPLEGLHKVLDKKIMLQSHELQWWDDDIEEANRRRARGSDLLRPPPTNIPRLRIDN